jgi:hypothetical protein
VSKLGQRKEMKMMLKKGIGRKDQRKTEGNNVCNTSGGKTGKGGRGLGVNDIGIVPNIMEGRGLIFGPKSRPLREDQNRFY